MAAFDKWINKGWENKWAILVGGKKRPLYENDDIKIGKCFLQMR